MNVNLHVIFFETGQLKGSSDGVFFRVFVKVEPRSHRDFVTSGSAGSASGEKLVESVFIGQRVEWFVNPAGDRHDLKLV